jgi:DNA-binding FadR family transcriptional regulator
MENTSTFTNVKTKDTSLPERVADQITQLIVDQQLQENDKLPNEFELASQLNVGRGTIREAVKLLVARNVLVVQRGKGTYITQNPGEIDDPLGFTFFQDQSQLGMDLLEVRMHLEPWVASLAAERATEEDLRMLEEKCRLVEEDIFSGQNHLEHDKALHVSIADCTHNLAVPKLIPIITYSVGLFGALNGRSLLTETIVGHRAILDAIRSHDPEAARKAMLDHLEQNKKELEQLCIK